MERKVKTGRSNVAIYCMIGAIHLMFLGCVTAPDQQDTATEKPLNRWGTDAQWAVLHAQEHRDVDALCVLLQDDEWVVRRSAALAFASVQDSTSVPCLMISLKDSMPAVRAASAFALGLSANNNASELLNALRYENDATTRQALFEAIGRIGDEEALEEILNVPCVERYDSLGSAWGLYRMALRKVASKTSVERELLLAKHTDTEVRLAATHALSRTPKELLAPAMGALREAMNAEPSNQVRMALTRAWGQTEGPTDGESFKHQFDQELDPLVKVNLLRALPQTDTPWVMEFLLTCVENGARQVRSEACDLIAARSTETDGPAMFQAGLASHHQDVMFALLHSTMTMGGDNSIAFSLLDDRFRDNTSPYIQAKLLTIIDLELPVIFEGATPIERLMQTVLHEGYSALERTTALAAVFLLLDKQEVNDIQQLKTLQEVLKSNDPGVLADVAARITGTDKLYTFNDPDLATACVLAMKKLDLPRDLEAHLMLQQAIAHLKGEPKPVHQRPIFNHPMDRERLNALPNGQEYVINTTQGDIRMITFVDEAPGSCLAFDSLVTAGYYDGKYFHRVVPNFVAQGGCPRGDGYGSMDWTLRTEIGLSGYGDGSVGLASAGPDTESCQFFITHSPTPHLDGKYTRFGQVVEGMEVVNELGVGDVILSITKNADYSK